MYERQGEFSGDGAFPYSTFTRQNQNHVLHLIQIPFLWDTCTWELSLSLFHPDFLSSGYLYLLQKYCSAIVTL